MALGLEVGEAVVEADALRLAAAVRLAVAAELELDVGSAVAKVSVTEDVVEGEADEVRVPLAEPEEELVPLRVAAAVGEVLSVAGELALEVGVAEGSLGTPATPRN